jgi:hypothetical protein
MNKREITRLYSQALKKARQAEHEANNSYEPPFDSYYEHGWVTGIQAERERIIKLLESRVEPDGSGSVLDEAGCSIADISDLIALINGENK